MPMTSLHDIFKAKPYLIWYVKDTDKLSEDSMLEHVLQYGNWEDVQQFIHIKGWKDTAALFFQTLAKKRINYTPEIVAYFTRYFRMNHE